MEHMISWNYLIAIYLFTAGLSAGAAVLAALGDIARVIDERVKRVAAYLAPFPVMLGLLCLVLDLHRPWNFYKVLIHYHVTSVMSWGAFFLLVFPIIAVIYAGLTYWNVYGAIRKVLAWLEIILGLSIGIYAGLLLSAIYANPVWSNPILAILFLVSAFSTGVCMVILVGKYWDGMEKAVIRRFVPQEWLPRPRKLSFDHSVVKNLLIIDVTLIIIELVVIATMIISWALLPNGDLALSGVVSGGYYMLFWIGVVLLGLLLPLIMAVLDLKGNILNPENTRIVAVAEPVLILIGGFLLRYVIVYGGQIVYPILTFPG